MGVKFTNLGGNDAFPTSFSDTFTRANNVSLGSNWVYQSSRINANDHYSIFSINTNAMLIVKTGPGIGVMNHSVVMPRSLLTGPVYGRSQFAQATFASFVGTSDNAISCLTRLDGTAAASTANQHAYTWGAASAIVSALRTELGETGVNLFVGACAAGDIFRLEVTAGAGGVNTIVAKRNGVIEFSGTDSTVPQEGPPGFYCSNNTAGGGQTWTNFACGLL